MQTLVLFMGILVLASGKPRPNTQFQLINSAEIGTLDQIVAAQRIEIEGLEIEGLESKRAISIPPCLINIQGQKLIL